MKTTASCRSAYHLSAAQRFVRNVWRAVAATNSGGTTGGGTLCMREMLVPVRGLYSILWCDAWREHQHRSPCPRLPPRLPSCLLISEVSTHEGMARGSLCAVHILCASQSFHAHFFKTRLWLEHLSPWSASTWVGTSVSIHPARYNTLPVLATSLMFWCMYMLTGQEHIRNPSEPENRSVVKSLTH